MKELRTIYKMPFGLPIPSVLLKIGAFFINTEAELVLKSRWVEPKTLIDNGYKFEFEHIEDALVDVLN
jgi:NAD dependent epimerase/dehydratase family enzyme